MSNNDTDNLDDQIAALAVEIADACDEPSDADSACSDADEFADYWMRGWAGDAAKSCVRQYHFPEILMWEATYRELRRLYCPGRHGPQKDVE